MNRKNYHKLLLLFFLSGATSLAYETVFVKLLGYVFGSTTYAVSTILAAFMGGLAAGSYLFGRYVERGRDGLKLYAYLELGVGVYCAFVPLLFRALEPVYVYLYRSFDLSMAQLTTTRFLLSSIIVLPPTLLMGGTFPVLAKYLILEAGEIGRRTSALYAANTYGAAFGVFTVTYFILGTLGIYGTLGLSVAGNIAIFIIAMRLARRKAQFSEAAYVIEAEQTSAGAVETKESNRFFDRLAGLLGFDQQHAQGSEAMDDKRAARRLHLFAFLSGAVAFTYEVTWTHVLNQTIGTSVYAFGIMLTTMLLGIAVGSHLVGKVIDAGKSSECMLALTQVLLGSAVIALLPLWDDIPKIFMLTRFFRPDFFLTETLRFIGCFTVMFIPAVLIGISFPLIIRVRAKRLPKFAEQLGAIYFFNTIGCILGSTLTGFLILPRLGAELTMLSAGGINILLGLAIAMALLAGQERFRARLAVAALIIICGGFFALPKWDLTQLNNGAHVLGEYNKLNESDLQILFYHEDVHGGVTSVVQTRQMRTLLTNAKFQGNDLTEMTAQKQFALAPLIFTHEFDRALVIGLGTGVTASTIASFPFKHIDIAEIAPGIVEAARDYFNHVNDSVLEDPRVQVHVTDGRNFVLLEQNRYDIITIELSNVWFAGAANLYSKDFYELCRERMNPKGIMQQWIQIHHIDTIDLLTVIKTMHSVFPHLAFFIGGGQGILVGSMSPLEVDYEKMAKLGGDAVILNNIAPIRFPADDIFSVLSNLYLYEENLADALRAEPSAIISSDWNPALEYTTPKGNQLPYAVLANKEFLDLKQHKDLPRVINAPEDKLNYLRGLVALRRRHFQNAVYYLSLSLEQGNKDPKCSVLLESAKKEFNTLEPGL